MKIHNTAFQGIKFLLVGGFATLIDLLLFEGLVLIITGNPLIAKSISFLIAVAIKYSGNKYWTFKQRTKENIHKEMFHFSIITIAALIIDVSVFYCATKMLDPQFGLSAIAWTRISVVAAALSSALLSFLGYKFLVFKK